jgi:hypothetical protein
MSISQPVSSALTAFPVEPSEVTGLFGSIDLFG